MFELTMGDGGHKPTPVGNYPATLTGIEPCETKCGKALRWTWQADCGLIISELSDAEHNPTPVNKTGRFLSALTNKALALNERVKPQEYVGQRYLVIVQPKGTDGKTGVTTFSKM